MELGTIVYHNKIYNLEYMTVEEVKDFVKDIQQEKKDCFTEIKKMLQES